MAKDILVVIDSCIIFALLAKIDLLSTLMTVK